MRKQVQDEEKKKWKEAIKHFMAVNKNDSKFRTGETQMHLGDCFFKGQKEYEISQKHYEKAFAVEKTPVHAIKLGKCLEKQKAVVLG